MSVNHSLHVVNIGKRRAKTDAYRTEESIGPLSFCCWGKDVDQSDEHGKTHGTYLACLDIDSILLRGIRGE